MRKVVLFGALAFSFSAIVFACSEDSPILVVGPDTGGGSSSSGTSGGTSGGSSGGEDSSTDGPLTIPDSGIADAPDPDVIVKDAGSVVDAAGCTTCDCDLDGVNRPACGDDAGTDCNDNDTRYRPLQGYVDLKPDPGKDGNWDCKNGVEKFYPTNVACSTVALGNCGGAQGFSGDPGCGEDGQYVKCKAVLLGILLCQVDTTETRKQACK